MTDTIDKQAFLRKLVRIAKFSDVAPASTSPAKTSPAKPPRVSFTKAADPVALPIEVFNQAVWELLQEDIARFRGEILAEYERLRKAALHKVWGEAFSSLSKSVSAEERLRRRRQAREQKRLEGKFADENKREIAEALISPNLSTEASRRERAWKFKADALKRSSIEAPEIKAAIRVFTDPAFTEEERKYAQQEIQRRYPDILDSALRSTRESKADNLVRNAPFDTPKTKAQAKEAAQIAVGLNLTEESAQNAVLLRQAITNVTSADSKYDSTYKRRFDRLFQYAAGYAGIDPRAAEAAAFIAGEYGDDLKVKAQTTKMRHYGVRLEPDEVDRQAAAEAVEQWKRQPADKRGDVDSHVAMAIANRLNERAKDFRTDERIKAATESGTWMPSEAYAIRDGKLVARKVGAKGSHSDAYVPFGGVSDAKDLVDSTIVRTRAFGGPTTEDLRLLMRSKAKRMIVVSGNGTFEMELNEPSKRLNANYWSASNEMQKIRQERPQNLAGVEHTLATLSAANPGMFKKVGVRQALDPKTRKPIRFDGQFSDEELTKRMEQYLEDEAAFDPTSSKEKRIAEQASNSSGHRGDSSIRRTDQYGADKIAEDAYRGVHNAINMAGLGSLMVPVEAKNKDGKPVTLRVAVNRNLDAIPGEHRKQAMAITDGWTSENDGVPGGARDLIESMDGWDAAAFAKYQKAIENYDEVVASLKGRESLPTRFQKDRPSLGYLTKDGEKEFARSGPWFNSAQGFRAGHEEAMDRLDSDDAEELSKAFEKVDEAEQMARIAYSLNAVRDTYGDGPAVHAIFKGSFADPKSGEVLVSSEEVKKAVKALAASDEAAEMEAKTGVERLDDDIDFGINSVKEDATPQDKAIDEFVAGKVRTMDDDEADAFKEFVGTDMDEFDADGKLGIVEDLFTALGGFDAQDFDHSDLRKLRDRLDKEEYAEEMSKVIWGHRIAHEKYPEVMGDIRNWMQVAGRALLESNDTDEAMMSIPAFPYDAHGRPTKGREQLDKLINAS